MVKALGEHIVGDLFEGVNNIRVALSEIFKSSAVLMIHLICQMNLFVS